MNVSISKIETFGLVDGPGIRTVVFLNGCKLRCKFCHNPETWVKKEDNYTTEELIKKILRSKPYFKKNGGVTFSGGEPLLQYEFLVDICKKLKDEKIHIAIDTSGIGNGNYKELLENIDMVLLDIKHIDKDGYINITQTDNLDKFFEFVNELNMTNVEVWIRQVIIPDVNDNKEYIEKLASFLDDNIKNITRVDFLPFHTLGNTKYEELGINNPYKDKVAMDKEKCEELHNYFLSIYNKKKDNQ